jgi:hypothetical protein
MKKFTMENIKLYEDFEKDIIVEDDMITIPKSTLEGWINGLKENEDLEVCGGHNTVIDDMESFLDDYYDNQIETSARKHAEDEIEPVEELSSDDENPNFIKKFEE